jgi:outer membrane protein TolC
MRKILLIAWLISATTAEAGARKLTLADAVHLAIAIDPIVAEAHVQDERAKLGTLRAQLDRFSLKVDGSVQELWNQANIGGAPQYTCAYAGGLLAFPSTTAQCGPLPNPWNLKDQPLVGVGSRVPDSGWTGLSNLSANLSYYLFSGFRVEANVKRAQTVKKAATVQIRQQQKDTALAVARAYWGVRRLVMLSGVQQAALAQMSEAEAVADARLKAGLAPPIDKNRATARKLQQLATLEDLAGQMRASQAQLGVALGLADELELVDEVDVPDQPPPTPEALLPDAFARRPELATAKLQVDIQHEQWRMARSNFFPQVTLFGLFQYGNNQFNVGSGIRSLSSAANPFADLSGSFTFGGTLNINFFDTLNTYTGSRDAWYEELRLKEEVRRFARLVDSDVRTAHANLLKLYARRTQLNAARDVSRDNLKILEARYKNGDALIIEYLDAAIDLANAELQLADVTAQLQLSWLELEAALGQIVGVDHG